MESKKTNELNDQELLNEHKKIKTNKLVNAILMGLFIGIFVYSVVRNGLSFFGIFPLVFVAILAKNGKKYNELEKELNNEITSRNIK